MENYSSKFYIQSLECLEVKPFQLKVVIISNDIPEIFVSLSPAGVWSLKRDSTVDRVNWNKDLS